MNKPHPFKPHLLTVFALAMINIAAIQSLKNFSIMAKIGSPAVLFCLITAVIFFIPCGLVSAELATGWPSSGGVYTWVKEAFGKHWGFVAIWLQWVANVVWYPTILSFSAGSLAYLFAPHLAQNKFYLLSTILSIFWLNTFLNFFGMRISSLISTIGVILGTLIPSILIILLGAIWLSLGEKSHLIWTWKSLIPDTDHWDSWIFLVGVLLSFSGMEMSVVHANEVKNPQRDYPKAILLSATIILALSILVTLAIALVIPSEKISLITGVMQAFTIFFTRYHISWAIPALALLTVLGTITMVSTWIVGPSKGLLETARHGDIPKIFGKVNRFHMPLSLMIFQGSLVTLLSFAFLCMPNVNASYWILTALATQLYLLMYLLMFAAAIRLRYSHPHIHRAYKIPIKNIGMWLTGGLGFIASLSAIIIGFIPPSSLNTGGLIFYESFLGCGITIMLITPLIIYWLTQYHHLKTSSES